MHPTEYLECPTPFITQIIHFAPLFSLHLSLVSLYAIHPNNLWWELQYLCTLLVVQIIHISAGKQELTQQ